MVDDPEELADRLGQRISFTKGYMSHLVQLTNYIRSCTHPVVAEKSDTGKL